MGKEGASTQRLLQLHGRLPVPICMHEDCVPVLGECVKGKRVGKRTVMYFGEVGLFNPYVYDYIYGACQRIRTALEELSFLDGELCVWGQHVLSLRESTIACRC